MKITGKEEWKKLKKKKRCVYRQKEIYLLKEKIIILKTLIVNKINYIISSIGLPEKVLIQTNSILFRFLWKKKFSNTSAFEKIKRKVLCSDTKNGGLNMFDISRIQSAAFLQWAEAVCTGPEEDWKTKAFQTLRPVAGKAVFS